MRTYSAFRIQLLELMVVALFCFVAGNVQGQIYVANSNSGTIGEYSTNGSVINASLISGLSFPQMIAVTGSDLFVVNYNSNSIGEYTTSGETLNSSLITGLNGPDGIAISGSDIFVVNRSNGSIGEYTTSGATVNASLITGLSNPASLTISGTNLFISEFGTNSVAEYTTSGTLVNATLISGLNQPYPPAGTYIEQTFSTMVGQTYVLTFWLGRNGDPSLNSSSLEAQVQILDATNTSIASLDAFPPPAPNDGWAMSSLVFTADSTTSTVLFTDISGSNPSTDLGLDNVSIIPLSVPNIATAPLSTAVVTGSNGTFTVSASANPAPISYQWQVSTDGGNTWSNLTDNSTYSGSATATLAIANTTSSQLGYQYQALLTNYAGTSTSIPVPLVVGVSDAHLTWLQNNFTSDQLANPAIVGDSAAPAGDGIPNLLKYALGLPPLENAQSLLPQVTVNNGILSLSFSAAQTDLIYKVEVSSDLINWGGEGAYGQILSPVIQMNGNIETAFYDLTSNPGPAFMHVVVSPPPPRRKIVAPAGG